MRLVNGIITNEEKTFEKLKFCALRREVFVQNGDSTVSTVMISIKYAIEYCYPDNIH